MNDIPARTQRVIDELGAVLDQVDDKQNNPQQLIL
jgi:hypothetical protein